MEALGQEAHPPPPRLCTITKQWNDDGIGLSIYSKTSGTFIGAVKPGGPSYRAGLRQGMKIIEVNGDSVEGQSHIQVVTTIRASGDRFQMLVADKDTCEYYQDRGIAISSVMPDIEIVVATRGKPFEWEDVAKLFDARISAYMASTTPRKKYLTEILLRVPLMYFIHLVFMLSPASDYFIVEFVLCLLRYLGSFFLFGCWGLPLKKLFKIYAMMTANMFIAWMMEKTYWTFQNSALEACHDVWLPWEQDTWWTPILVTFVLQGVHLVYVLEKKLDVTRTGTIVVGFLLVPYVFCSFGIGLYYFSPIQYWLSKIIFCACLIVDVTLSFDDGLYNDANGQFRLPPLPGPWFVRDLLAVFGVVYYIGCAVFDLLFMYNASYVFSMSYLSSCIGTWCTTFTIITALGALFAFFSNAAAAMCLKLIKGEWNFLAIMNSPLGSRVNITMTTYCIEAGILSVSEETRILNMDSVLFLAIYVIFLQAWDLTENQFLLVVNSGETNRWFAFLRVLFFSVILLTVPTFITVYVSPKIEVDLWLMLNLSGNVMMLSRAMVVFVEIALVSCTWYVDRGLDRLEDVIYYTRVSKTAVTVMLALANAYYRFSAPFFDTWWVTRAAIIISDISIVTYTMCRREWAVFQARQQRVSMVVGLPDASVEEINENDDNCAVCYGTMTSAKKLPCLHLFHELCLRKWFQVKQVCPLCNINAQ